MRIVVITPMRNEAAYLPRVIAAMQAQERVVDRWVIVDDGSTDGTPDLVPRDVPWIELVHAPQVVDGDDRLLVAAEARAFLWALAEVVGPDDPWELLGKLDGDIALDPRHFARLEEEFGADPQLGIAGGWLHDELPGGALRAYHVPDFHVNGGQKLWRRPVWEVIGGIEPRLGWDTADEVAARMHGWRSQTFRDLTSRHLKPSGSVGGQLRGRARHGECAWILGYPVWLVVVAAARLAVQASPKGAGGLAYLGGWARAAAQRREREPAELRAFIRREQRARLRRALSRRSASDGRARS